jgi:hypothetical protein
LHTLQSQHWPVSSKALCTNKIKENPELLKILWSDMDKPYAKQQQWEKAVTLMVLICKK